MQHQTATARLLTIILLILVIGGAGLYALAYGIPGLPPTSMATTTVPISPIATATSSVPVIGSTTPPVAPTKPVTPPVLDTSVTITNADNNSTIHIKNGEAFVLQLGGGLNWSGITFDPSSSVVQLSGASGVDQGSYKAVAPGTITLKATGAPICKPNQACPMFLALFTTTIVVQ